MLGEMIRNKAREVRGLAAEVMNPASGMTIERVRKGERELQALLEQTAVEIRGRHAAAIETAGMIREFEGGRVLPVGNAEKLADIADALGV